jgi:hypothetical protein
MSDDTEPMLPEEMRECLVEIGWSHNYLIKRLGSTPGTIMQMLAGRRPIPLSLAEFLREWRAFSQARRKPPLWGMRRGDIERLRAAERDAGEHERRDGAG